MAIPRIFSRGRGSRGADPLGCFMDLVWQQPIWAIPFALVFGSVFGSWSPEGYWRAYLISLSFAYSIGYAIWALESFVLPRLGEAEYRGGTTPLWQEATLYAVFAIVGGYLAALINHIWIQPGFLGGAREALVSGFFILMFMGLFTGISYARVFYRQSVERARAVETTRAELAQAELRALRAQINPHFLFNTLNSIAALININPAAAEDVTTRLADIFRYALTASAREQARLGDELAFLRDYLEIEHQRFGDRLQVCESIDAGLEDLEVPSLLLQPIVENAVKYGVSHRVEGGTVGIAVHRDGDQLILEVTDDGPGITAGTPPSGTGFGLSSVRERLRAAGLAQALHIDSSPERGTLVRITIPVVDAGTRTTEARS